jgi:hypothetical protein
MKLVIATIVVVLPFAFAYADQCPPNHPPGPPPAAVEACRNANAGDACSFDGISGTCARGPDGNGPLACKPGAWSAVHDRGHGWQLQQRPWAASQLDLPLAHF